MGRGEGFQVSIDLGDELLKAAQKDFVRFDGHTGRNLGPNVISTILVSTALVHGYACVQSDGLLQMECATAIAAAGILIGKDSEDPTSKRRGQSDIDRILQSPELNRFAATPEAEANISHVQASDFLGVKFAIRASNNQFRSALDGGNDRGSCLRHCES